MNEVQVKKDDAAKEEVVFENITDLQKAIEEPKNSVLLDEYLTSMKEEKEQEFLDKYIKPKADPADSAEKKPKGKAKPDADEEITIENLKIKSDLLGTYDKNAGNFSEAVVKALTGKKEADKTIKALKDAEDDMKAEMQRLNEKILALEKKPEGETKPKVEKKQVEIPEMVMPNMDEIDFLTEEGQKKAKEAITQLAKSTLAFRDKADALEAELVETKLGVADMGKKTSQAQQTNEEFTTIDKFIGKHDEFTTKRSSSEIEQDYLACIEELGRVAQIKEPMYNADGSIGRKHMAAFNEFMDDSSELHEKAVAEKVKLPEDFADLNLVYKVRAIRAEHPTMDYEKAFRFYKSEHPEEFTKNTKPDKGEVEEKIERGVEKRKEFVKEVPLNTGADMNDMSKVSAKTINSLLEKMPKDRSKEEKELVKKYLTVVAGMPEAEVDAINQ